MMPCSRTKAAPICVPASGAGISGRSSSSGARERAHPSGSRTLSGYLDAGRPHPMMSRGVARSAWVPVGEAVRGQDMSSDAPVGPLVNRPSAVPEITVTIGADGRRLELVIPDEGGVHYVANEIFNGKCYEPVAGVPPPRAVLDIGANVGLAAAYFRMAYPEALIHCVE